MLEQPVKIKICGLMSPKDVRYVNRALPDYCGFVFAEGRRRYVTPDAAAEMREMLDPRIRPAGVFVDTDPEFAASLADWGFIDMIQLHGSENEAYIAKLRKFTDVPVIKAFHITKKSDLDVAARCSADMILLDNGCGTGETFDQDLLVTAGWYREKKTGDGEILLEKTDKYPKKPVILAGGLHAGNLREVIRKYRPFGVDLSSGAETDGRKDREKIKACVDAARGTLRN